MSRKTVTVYCAVAVLVLAVAALALYLRTPRVLTEVSDIRHLTPDDCRSGQRVLIRGVVTYSTDQEFVVQDETGGVLVSRQDPRHPVGRRDRVEVDGKTDYASAAVIRDPKVRWLSAALLPKPFPVRANALLGGEAQDVWVELTGVARATAEEGDSPALVIDSGGIRVLAVFPEGDAVRLARFLGGTITVTGVVRSRYSESGPVLRARIIAQGRNAISVAEGEHRRETARPAAADDRVLTRIGDIRALPPAHVPPYPVRVQGVVTYYDPANWMFFVQDGTEATYVAVPSLPSFPPGIAPGVLVEVTGRAATGKFSPIIGVPEVRVIGSAPGMPAPALLTDEGVISGMLDTRWVEAKGTVRQVDWDPPGRVKLLLATHGERLDVTLPWDGTEVPQHLIDARVRVRGVYGAVANRLRQLVGARIMSPSWEFLSVLHRPRRAESDLKPQPIGGLPGFSPQRSPAQRVKVAGVVTAVEAAALFVEDASGGLQVRTSGQPAASVGDRVEVLGYMSTLQLRPVMEDATVEAAGRGTVEPEEIAADEVAEGSYHGRLVKMQARIIDWGAGRTESSMILEASKRIFNARFLRSGAKGDLGFIAKGDMLEVTGVCSVTAVARQGSAEALSFELLLRSPADVKVITTASWFTLEHTLGVLTCMTGAALLAVAWGATLRRRVTRQTAIIRRHLAAVEQLNEAACAANRSKSEFLANMSHEIRTPLNGIYGMTELALGCNPSAEQREYLEMVKRCSDSLLGIINGILDLSKIEAGKLQLEKEPFGLRELVSSTGKMLKVRAAAKGLELTWQVEEQVPEQLAGDAGRLGQVLVNLVGNATKFTERGSIAIAVALDPDAAPGPGPVRLHFSVRDTGIGILRERLSSIFEPFEQADNSITRKYGGTGLGLAISSRLVKLMGGAIRAESTPGAGSTFHFTAGFDLALAAAAGTAPGCPPGEPGDAMPKRLRVLLAEDNEVNQRVAVRMLEKQGCTVTTVADGKAAVDAAAAGEFDVVLMDVHMPVMDGLEATRTIRRDRPERARRLPIIALTARAMREDEKACLDAGMDAYLAKPIHASELMALLARVVKGG